MTDPNWADLFRLLSGMSRLLQSCTGNQDLLDICEWYVPRIFPNVSGAIHVFASADSQALSMTWGEDQAVSQPPDNNPQLAAGQPMTEGNVLTLPLMAGKQPLAALQLTTPNAGDLEAIHGLALVTAEHLALTMDNLRVHSRLKNLAVKDALTGLFNRRHFDSTMIQATREAAESGAPLCVIMFDIDHFKRLNDTKGHDAGDVALQSVGNFLGALGTPEITPCRYGGEEFFLILKNTEYSGAMAMAEDIRQGISALDIRHKDAQVSPIHVSVGVARFPDHGDTAEALAKAADNCLYAAKEGGRNQVVGCEDLPKD